MSLMMDGVLIQSGDYLWHKDMGQWRVSKVKTDSVEIKNEFGVKQVLSQVHVSGEARSFGWAKPVLLWKQKNDPKWDVFIGLVNQIRSVIYG